MIINNNIPALSSFRQMGINQNAAQSSMEKLSSGLRINRAGDDAAGLTISEKMRAQIRGLDQASRNAQDGISLIQTAEGALDETHNILQRMRELANQSANGTNTKEDREAIQNEINQLKQEIDRIGDTTEFNTQKLLNGNLKSAGSVSVGQDTTTGSIIAKQTAGEVTGNAAMHEANAAITASEFKQEKVVIDGTEITVDWQNLSSSERNILIGVSNDASARNAAKDLIVNKINEAIDASGANVAHVTGYVDDSGSLVLQSGSKGTNSGFEFKTDEAILSSILSDENGTVAAANSEVTAGTTKYSGAEIQGPTEFHFEVDGIRLQGSMAAVAGDGTVDMTEVASRFETAIKTAVDSYNTAQGRSAGQEGFIEAVKVNALNDGRLQVVSESGPVSFSDKTGATMVSDLGLSEAQTSASSNGGMTYQIGANRGQQITFSIGDMRSASLGVSGVNVTTEAGASKALESLDKAISKVSEQRSSLGAVQNRLEHTINNLNNSAENLQAAESRIRDVDMAREVMEMTKNNILSQASQAMLAQANQAPQAVLQLLG
ncbi:flagellin [Evansella sp. AB-rgal1]|uniref:flagellin N-terminal helical domain-containing protein n=1 Tax=Evansella sp. AB-rgal1 TaxID=3242696 RepID=UPI00359D0015